MRSTKVVAFVGSPRTGGNTEIVTAEALDVIGKAGMGAELIRLGRMDVRPCIDCDACKSGETCPIDDELLPLYFAAKEADGIIMASPVYFSAVSAQTKAFMDRAGLISYRNGHTFNRKVGGALTVAGRNGGNCTNSQLLLWFMILGMIVPGSTDWNCAFGNQIGEVREDRDGLETIREFAENFAWLIRRLA